MSSSKGRLSLWKKKLFKHPPTANSQWPTEFICPISMAPMADPVIVSSGQSYERRCIEIWMDLGHRYCYVNGTKLNSSTVIPNVALRTAISNWCQVVGVQKPNPPDQETAKRFVQRILAKGNGSSRENSPCNSGEHGENRDNPSTASSYRSSPGSAAGTAGHFGNDFQKNLKSSIEKSNSSDTDNSSTETVSDHFQHLSLKPPVRLTHSATAMNIQQGSLDSSASSGELSVPIPLATKPCSFSSQPPEIVEENEAYSSVSYPEILVEFVQRLRHSQTFEQEQAVIDLRKLTRTNAESRTTLCNSKLFLALLPLLTSRYSGIQINSVAALVNLSLENNNKVGIVRAGAVPYLIDVLKMGHPEAQEHAAGAIFSLALNDENKTAIGVLGAIPPLIHILRSSEERGRQDALMALYHLSFAQSNRAKLIKVGAVSILLSLAREDKSDFASRALLILNNIAANSEGRKALLDANAIGSLVGILAQHQKDKTKGNQLIQEHTVAVLLLLSRNNLRFKSSATQAGLMELLVGLAESDNVRTKEKASILTSIMKGVSDDEDGDSILSRSHWKTLGWSSSPGPNSTDF